MPALQGTLQSVATLSQYLLDATRFGRLEEVKQLLARGASPNFFCKHGKTALAWGSMSGQEAIVTALLQAGADVRLQEPDLNGTALIEAMTPTNGRGEYAAIAATLLKAGVEVNAQDDLGFTALMHAAINGYTDATAILLKHGADPNIQTKDGPTGALLWAAWEGHTAIVAILLRNEYINPNLQDDMGQTPLIGAAFNGHTDVVKTLLKDRRVNTYLKDIDGLTALEVARQEGHTAVAALLQRHKPRT